MGSVNAVNFLNIFLMALSAISAFVLPLETFVLAYAILGPLHYFTEISWLHDRNYFSISRSKTIWVLGGLCVLSVVLGKVFSLPFNGLMFISFGVAAFLSFGRNKWAYTAIALAVMYCLNHLALGMEFHRLWFSAMLPTLIHVYVFTGLFILYGSLKSKKISGYLSLACFVLLGATFFIFSGPESYLAKTWASDNFRPFLGVAHGFMRIFDMDSYGAVSVFRFMAFAYLYHYLNWFSKTKIIGWSSMSRRRALTIVAAWFVTLGFYYYDYRLGMTVISLFSFGHVVLEFPLNFHCVKGIFQELNKRLQFTQTYQSDFLPGGKAVATSSTEKNRQRRRRRRA